MIGDITPTHQTSDISVFSLPQIAFNTSINTEFRMENLLNQVETYRVLVDEVKISQNATSLAYSAQWNNDRTSVQLTPVAVLPEESDVKLDVKIHVEKKIGTDAWKAFADNAGKQEYEMAASQFKTGTAPDYITPENVAYSYPVENQYNFHPQEYQTAYIGMKQDISYLFKTQQKDGNWIFFARYTNALKEVKEIPLSYNSSTRTASMAVPSDLKLSDIHHLKLMKRLESKEMSANVKKDETKLADQGVALETSVANNTLTSSSVSGEKELYKIDFRTSSYKTFVAKLNAMTGAQDLFNVTKDMNYVIGKRLNTTESFDETETRGKSGYCKPLVQGLAGGKEKWFTNFLNPVMYNNYKTGAPSVQITSRDINKLGLCPLKAISIYNHSSDYYNLTTGQIQTGVATPKGDEVYIQYNVPFYTALDYSELKGKAANLYKLTPRPENVKRLLENTGYMDINEDVYSMDLLYVLPGIEKISSRKTFKIKF